MKIISHRGNIRGIVPGRENAPSYIDCALGNGYDVEIDIWSIDRQFFLGHDNPQYQVTWNWIFKRQDNLWLHCKNADAAKTCGIFQAFCHTSDPYSFTTRNKIWLHDLSQTVDKNTIIPLLTSQDLKHHSTRIHDAYGVCTDYPAYL